MSWQASSFVLLALALAVGFAWYERDKPPARVVALVAAMAALAVVGRLAFAAIPNVKPTTDIVLFAGYALGAVPGFVVGAVTAIVSNIFLSQGPWTAWQMAGWGAVGVAGALLARALRGREPNRFVLAGVCGLAGLVFGAWMDVYQWTLTGRQDLDSYLVVAGSSLPYNVAHAVGNVVFCLLIGPLFIRALRRYRRRLEVSWRPAPATIGAAVTVLALFALLPAAAGAATPSQRAERYLLRAQNADGGFGAGPRQRSSPLYSGWTALGLAAAGHNPRDVARGRGRSLAGYVKRSLRGVRDVGEIERTALVLRAAGLDPRNVARRDLISEILRRHRGNGSIAGFVSYTAFGILAIRAAGEAVGSPTVRWLLGAQNGDGGFGVAPASGSDSDMTGAVLQVLAVTGRARSGAARRAVAYLRDNQGSDGGFGQMRGRSANAQSTAYAVQGLLAVGAARGSVARGRAYLVRLQRRDGSIAYSSTSSQTPVWVTAQALMALRRAPLPLEAVPRERRPAESAAAPSAPSSADPPAAAAAPSEPAGDNEPSARAGAVGGVAAPAGPDAAAGAATAAEAKRSAVPREGGLTLDPAPDAARTSPEGDGGGVPAVLVISALAAFAGVLWLFRRRLRRFVGRRPAPS
jgi:energy-coupling factor transport system substrate-specific component